jgi:hypothetical protein
VNIRSKKEEKISNKDIHYNSRVTREVHVETYGTSRRLGTARNSKLETTQISMTVVPFFVCLSCPPILRESNRKAEFLLKNGKLSWKTR